MRNAILLASAIFLSSCGERTVYVNNPLKLPAAPIYATVSADEFECLAQDSYDRLEISIEQKNTYIETLQNIIKKTHE